MLRGISCVAVVSVDVEPVMKAVVVIRLVETYPGFVLIECDLFRMKFQTAAGKICSKGSGSAINRF